MLNFSEERQVSMSRKEPGYETITGWHLPLTPIDAATHPSGSRDRQRTARTAVGIDHDGNQLLLVVVDGLQPGYSVGMSIPELARFMIECGADDAINLDGGDSSTMVYAPHGRHGPGSSRLLNTPIFTGIANREAPVGNHLGFNAKPLG